ncbi:unnamed protein product [Trichobilharzia szidati]|nr:unnamed protein product [Trichobilharzia szidati]
MSSMQTLNGGVGRHTLEDVTGIVGSPTSSFVSTEASECSSSSNRPRKKYECVPEVMKTAPDYIDQRIRNRNAVKRFREKSKTKAKQLEEEKASLTALTKLYDNELIRINRSKQPSYWTELYFFFFYFLSRDFCKIQSEDSESAAETSYLFILISCV